MNSEVDNDQEDFFPKELAEWQAANEKRLADERIRAQQGHMNQGADARPDRRDRYSRKRQHTGYKSMDCRTRLLRSSS